MMDKIKVCAEALAEAIRESEEYANRKIQNEAVKHDEAVIDTLKRYRDAQKELEASRASMELDGKEIDRCYAKVQSIQDELEHLPAVVARTEANRAFEALVDGVNEILNPVLEG